MYIYVYIYIHTYIRTYYIDISMGHCFIALLSQAQASQVADSFDGLPGICSMYTIFYHHGYYSILRNVISIGNISVSYIIYHHSMCYIISYCIHLYVYIYIYVYIHHIMIYIM